MTIIVTDKTKYMLARTGANKLFGDDVDRRRRMTEQEGIQLFDGVWNGKLRHVISMAESCEAREAYERLTENQRNYFDFDQEHRAFRMQELNAEFIAQLTAKPDGDTELTQLWRVSSSDTHPKTLFVTFETVEQRQRFRRLASHLRINDEELGLQLILDFMRHYPEQLLPNSNS